MNQNFLSGVPALKLFIPFVAGISIHSEFFKNNEYFSNFLNNLIPQLIILSALLLLIHFLKRSGLLLIPLLLFFTGFWVSGVQQFQKQKTNFEFPEKKITFIGKVANRPVSRSGTTRFEVEVIGIKYIRFVKLENPARVYVYTKNDPSSLNSGMYFSTRAKFKTIENPLNVLEFNYKEFLERKGIYHTVYVNTSDTIKILERSEESSYWMNRLKVVDVLHEQIRRTFKDKNKSAVLESILFGLKDDLPKELVESYASTGVIHILAVSGMHVGIVFGLINFLLVFVFGRHNYTLIKSLLAILAVWVYCYICGFAPSTCRAGLMISLYTLAKPFDRMAISYNLVAFSAFVLLVLEPNSLFNVGFQLSFSAVVGILGFYPFLSRSFRSKNKILNSILNLVHISLSAQLGTLPVSLYHFNQFPVYFLLANLLIVPLVAILIYSGMAYLIFNKVALISLMLTKLLNGTIDYINNTVIWIRSLDHALIEGIYINEEMLLFMVLCILCCIFWVNIKSSKAFIAMIGFLFCFVLVSNLHKTELKSSSELVFFKIRKHNGLFIRQSDRSLLITDSISSTELKYHIQKFLISRNAYPPIHFHSLNEIKKEDIPGFQNLKTLKDRRSIVFENVRIDTKHRVIEMADLSRIKIKDRFFRLSFK